MAHVHGECSILLTDGSPCRRTARYACGNWHLICASHRSEDAARTVESGCPICSGTLLQFTAIEDGVAPRRRRDDSVFSFGSFFRRATDTWLPELKDAPPEEAPRD